MTWLAAFALTQAIEVPLYRRALIGRRLPLALCLGFVASALTHPLVWLAFPVLVQTMQLSYAVAWLILEGFAVSVEAIYLKRIGVRDAWWWALMVNATSAGIGLTIHALI